MAHHGCHDLFIDSPSNDYVFSTANFSKPLVFYGLPSHILELSKVIKALHPALMVMVSSHSIYASAKKDQDSTLSLKNPHHSIAHIENQSISQSSHPSFFLMILLLNHWRNHNFQAC